MNNLTKKEKQFLLSVWSVKGKNTNVMTRKQWYKRKKEIDDEMKRISKLNEKPTAKKGKKIINNHSFGLKVESPAPGELQIAKIKK